MAPKPELRRRDVLVAGMALAACTSLLARAQYGAATPTGKTPAFNAAEIAAIDAALVMNGS